MENTGVVMDSRKDMWYLPIVEFNIVIWSFQHLMSVTGFDTVSDVLVTVYVQDCSEYHQPGP